MPCPTILAFAQLAALGNPYSLRPKQIFALIVSIIIQFPYFPSSLFFWIVYACCLHPQSPYCFSADTTLINWTPCLAKKAFHPSYMDDRIWLLLTPSRILKKGEINLLDPLTLGNGNLLTELD